MGVGHGLYLPGRRYAMRDALKADAMGPRWSEGDTENKISQTGGEIACAGGLAVPSWGDPRVWWSRAFRRKAGLTLDVGLVYTSGDGPLVGFNEGNAKNQYMRCGVYFWADKAFGTWKAGAGSQMDTLALGIVPGTEYRVRVVLLETGAAMYLSGGTFGALGQRYTLMGIEEVNADSPLYLIAKNYSGVFKLRQPRVWYGRAALPKVRDTFTRADSALTLGNAETGQAWQAVAGTWGIASNKGYSATDADLDVAVVELGISDYVLGVACTGAYGTDNRRQLRPVFGYLDAANHLEVDVTSGNARLIKIDGGSGSVLATASRATADGDTLSWRVLKVGNAIEVRDGETFRFRYTLAGGDTKYAAGTKAGVILAKTGVPVVAATVDNFAVWGGL